jgi:uncharacterized FAD-dependent dehydrogenase
MPLRISHIRLPVETPESELPLHLARRLGLAAADVQSFRVLKKSLDARSRNDLEFVYSALVELPSDALASAALKQHLGRDVVEFRPPEFHDPDPGGEPLSQRPVVVGTGPAGLLAGYYLALKGYRPLIIERGPPVKERVPEVRKFDRGGPFDQENNYLFGEGGAGCFSDGKLTCRLEGSDVDWVLHRFVECGGRPSIVYENRPHLGSNKLPMLCRNFRRKIEALGGEYQFNCRLESVDIQNGELRGLGTSGGYLPTKHVILGIGHSARDTYEMLFAAGVPMLPKAFQLGLRIEQPQMQIDRHKYGKREYRDLLGAADYTIQVRGQADVFTFCMCAGGVIIPSISEPGRFCTNGMSNSRHDTPFANSGVMVTLDPKEFGSDHPLAGMELQRRYEAAAFELGRRDYLCPIQSARDFLARRLADDRFTPSCSYKRGVVPAELDPVLPPSVIAAIRHSLPAMDRKLAGNFLKHAMLVGPEMRGSSPIRIDRDAATRECPNIRGLYPIGEGAGYAGGIVSAAVDGLRSARAIVERFAPLS